MSNNCPVILVPGLLGFGPTELGGLPYWGAALEVPSALPRFAADVGPLSSPHDRACELAAQIKGRRVNYGQGHALTYGHEQHGRDFSGRGLWPAWDERHPVHLVGHSLGAQTIRCLQHLLAQDFWGWGSNHRWISSVSSLSGALNGSTAAYYYGVDRHTGLIRRRSGIVPILRLLEIYTAAGGTVLDAIYDFNLDHWGFARRATENLEEYLLRVGRSRFYWDTDNAFYAISLQGAYRDNGRWPTYPSTYYFAYVTEQTFRLHRGGRYYPSPLMNPALHAPARYIGRLHFAQPPIPGAGFDSRSWWENDGLVSTYSQQVPRSNGNHNAAGEFTLRERDRQYQTGAWHHMWLRGVDHAAITIAPRIWQRPWQRYFYEALFALLNGLVVV